jgi:4-hydroxyphenylacetate decarboxylase small subunit
MTNSKISHKDCYNYAPVDVAKGLCHRTKELVAADEPSCELSERAPRCKFCVHFTLGAEPYLGTCGALSSNQMTYPDLSAVTCESFRFPPA